MDFFRDSHLVQIWCNPWEVWSFFDIFWSVEFFRGPHLVHFRWSSSEIWSFIDISWRWNFQRSTLNTFSWNHFWEVLTYIDVFSECGIFQRFILSTFSMKLLRSLIFHQYFLSVEFFRGPHLGHFRWNPWGVWTFIDISQVLGFFRGPHLAHFRWNSWEVWTFIDIFYIRNFSEVHT